MNMGLDPFGGGVVAFQGKRIPDWAAHAKVYPVGPCTSECRHCGVLFQCVHFGTSATCGWWWGGGQGAPFWERHKAFSSLGV